MNETPTPETSEAWDAVSRTPDGMYDSSIPMSQFAYAMVDHSRKLERERDELAESILNLSHPNCQMLLRERDEARNEIIGWRNKWDCAIDMAARAENALDEMTLRWERTNDALFDERAERKRVDEYATDLCCTLRCELDDERALADQLAARLEPLLIHTWRETPPTKAELAFEAWKEARK